MARIGLMLYTLRKECAEDYESALRDVAAMGYEGVELFDLHGHEPGTVRGWLDASRLVACGRHADLGTIETRLPDLAAEAGAVGWRRLVVSWVDPAAIESDAAAVRDRLARAARAAAAVGLELGYHNHDAEVRPGDSGRSFLDDMPSEVFLELDLGWTWWGGADPVALLDRAQGRCPLVHVKDFATRGERSFRPVGDGAVGYERIVPAALRAGVEWLLVEQDETDGPAPEAARRSLAALQPMLARAT